jgi:hypothetical protein
MVFFLFNTHKCLFMSVCTCDIVGAPPTVEDSQAQTIAMMNMLASVSIADKISREAIRGIVRDALSLARELEHPVRYALLDPHFMALSEVHLIGSDSHIVEQLYIDVDGLDILRHIQAVRSLARSMPALYPKAANTMSYASTTAVTSATDNTAMAAAADVRNRKEKSPHLQLRALTHCLLAHAITADKENHRILPRNVVTGGHSLYVRIEAAFALARWQNEKVNRNVGMSIGSAMDDIPGDATQQALMTAAMASSLPYDLHAAAENVNVSEDIGYVAGKLRLILQMDENWGGASALLDALHDMFVDPTCSLPTPCDYSSESSTQLRTALLSALSLVVTKHGTTPAAVTAALLLFAESDINEPLQMQARSDAKDARDRAERGEDGEGKDGRHDRDGGGEKDGSNDAKTDDEAADTKSSGGVQSTNLVQMTLDDAHYKSTLLLSLARVRVEKHYQHSCYDVLNRIKDVARGWLEADIALAKTKARIAESALLATYTAAQVAQSTHATGGPGAAAFSAMRGRKARNRKRVDADRASEPHGEPREVTQKACVSDIAAGEQVTPTPKASEPPLSPGSGGLDLLLAAMDVVKPGKQSQPQSTATGTAQQDAQSAPADSAKASANMSVCEKESNIGEGEDHDDTSGESNRSDDESDDDEYDDGYDDEYDGVYDGVYDGSSYGWGKFELSSSSSSDPASNVSPTSAPVRLPLPVLPIGGALVAAAITCLAEVDIQAALTDKRNNHVSGAHVTRTHRVGPTGVGPLSELNYLQFFINRWTRQKFTHIYAFSQHEHEKYAHPGQGPGDSVDAETSMDGPDVYSLYPPSVRAAALDGFMRLCLVQQLLFTEKKRGIQAYLDTRHDHSSRQHSPSRSHTGTGEPPVGVFACAMLEAFDFVVTHDPDRHVRRSAAQSLLESIQVLYTCINECMHGWMDGCMDGWMDGWMDISSG